MTVGTGIGIGIVVGGQPVTGMLHPEGGHIRVARSPGDSFPGSCPFHGDCLEGIASGSAIAARTGGEGEEVSDDDPVWPFVIDAIAEGCANLFLTLASERIVLGGGVINSRSFLADAIAARCAELLGGYLPYIADRAPIEAAALGQDAGPRGSLLLAEARSRRGALTQAKRKRRRLVGAAASLGDQGSLELARNFVEGAAQVAADVAHRGNRGNGNESGNQAVLNRGRTLVVLDQLQKLGHLWSP